EADRLDLLAPVEMRIDQLRILRHHLAHLVADLADLHGVGPDDAELDRIADRRARHEAGDAGEGPPGRAPGACPAGARLETRSRTFRSLVTMTICAKFGFGSTGLRPRQKRGAPAPT